jgi:hypothetical protein
MSLEIEPGYQAYVRAQRAMRQAQPPNERWLPVSVPEMPAGVTFRL